MPALERIPYASGCTPDSYGSLKNILRTYPEVSATFIFMNTGIETVETTEIENGRLRILLRSSAEGYARCSGTCGACCCYEKEEI